MESFKGDVSLYDKLTGRDIEIIKMKKIKSQLVQQRRKLQNRIRKDDLEFKEINAPAHTNNFNFSMEGSEAIYLLRYI